jgi:hypothetical protein
MIVCVPHVHRRCIFDYCDQIPIKYLNYVKSTTFTPVSSLEKYVVN